MDSASAVQGTTLVRHGVLKTAAARCPFHLRWQPTENLTSGNPIKLLPNFPFPLNERKRRDEKRERLKKYGFQHLLPLALLLISYTALTFLIKANEGCGCGLGVSGVVNETLIPGWRTSGTEWSSYLTDFGHISSYIVDFSLGFFVERFSIRRKGGEERWEVTREE